jgi:pimeloyl-ACP methyl ester carboxylesterase
MSREEAREYGSMFHDRDRTEVFFRIFIESFDPRSMRELRNQLSATRDDRRPFVATRLLWARQDKIVPPAFGPRYHLLLPTAELVWFDRSSHFLQVDDPVRTVQEIKRFDEN